MNELVIIGNGKMAEALCKGLGNHFKLLVLGRDDKKLKLFKKNLDFVDVMNIDDVQTLDAKIVILCVKPYALESVSAMISGTPKLLISILAGVTIEKIKKMINAKSYIRAMPNLAAKYHKSMTTLSGSANGKEFSMKLFAYIGKTLWVNTQKELDIATAIAGSGPAYLAIVAEAMVDGGVKSGLTRSDALELVRGLFDGFDDTLNEFDPAQIKNNVMSPAGTTASGVYHLEEKGVRSAFIGCVESAYNRAVELGK